VKLGVKDKAAVRQSLERIMAEEFEQVVVGHGLLMRDRAKERYWRGRWARGDP